MRRNQSDLGYFLIGIAVGGVTALLLAPKSGPDARRYLRRRGDAGADYVKRRTDELSRNAMAAMDRGRKNIQAQVDSVASSVAAMCR
jgi:gas vesicle protein